jgi:hypothetical protein
MDLFTSTLIAVVAVLGGIVGWFSRGRVVITIAICVPLSFLASVAFMIWNGYKVDIADLVWGATFFTGYIFTPCLVAGALMTFVAYLIKRRTTSQKI